MLERGGLFGARPVFIHIAGPEGAEFAVDQSTPGNSGGGLLMEQSLFDRRCEEVAARDITIELDSHAVAFTAHADPWGEVVAADVHRIRIQGNLVDDGQRAGGFREVLNGQEVLKELRGKKASFASRN